MGRKARPVDDLEATGRSHMTKAEKEQRRENQLQIPSDNILVPDFVLDEEAAYALWEHLSPQLIEAKLLNNFTAPAFAILCDAWAKYREASEQVRDQGIVIEQHTQTGSRDVQNPALLVMHKMAGIIKTYCTEFYLTPAALASYEKNAGKEKPKDEFGEEFD